MVPTRSTATSPDLRFNTSVYWSSGVTVTKPGSLPTDTTAITRREAICKLLTSPACGLDRVHPARAAHGGRAEWSAGTESDPGRVDSRHRNPARDAARIFQWRRRGPGA